ncbi:MAG: hypothetical protein LC126_11150 [Bryobacterales bacterium]|nr:hypothetical protein [Bryobacterales bacterium]
MTSRSQDSPRSIPIRSVLEEALASAELADAGPGRLAEGENFFRAVYRREGEPCIRCGGKIRRVAQGGRSAYFRPGRRR